MADKETKVLRVPISSEAQAQEDIEAALTEMGFGSDLQESPGIKNPEQVKALQKFFKRTKEN